MSEEGQECTKRTPAEEKFINDSINYLEKLKNKKSM